MPNKKIKRRTKKLKGGDVIGSGSFGCVFKPNFKCDPSDKVDDNLISKIFVEKAHMDEEVEETKKIDKIDPNAKYFVRIHKSCKFDKELNKKQLENELKKDISSKCMEDLNYMIIGTYAGKDLTKVIIDKNEIVMNIIKNILKGLDLLRKNNLVHRDIKPANLTYDTKNKTSKIIDYGTVISLDRKDNLSRKLQVILTKGTPKYMPMEHYYLVNLFFGRNRKKFPGPQYFAGPVEFNDIFNKLTPKHSNEKIRKLLSKEKSVKYLKEKYEMLHSKGPKVIEKYVQKYLNNMHKNDIYALGLSILYLIKNNHLILTNNMIDLLEKMIHYDIDKRMNADELLKYMEVNSLTPKSRKIVDRHSLDFKNKAEKIIQDIMAKSDKSDDSLLEKMHLAMRGSGKKRKIRKHRGINQQSGKLKKGYKYSGKKLKSGIPQIIKINKKK